MTFIRREAQPFFLCAFASLREKICLAQRREAARIFVSRCAAGIA